MPTITYTKQSLMSPSRLIRSAAHAVQVAAEVDDVGVDGKEAPTAQEVNLDPQGQQPAEVKESRSDLSKDKIKRMQTVAMLRLASRRLTRSHCADPQSAVPTNRCGWPPAPW